MAYQRVLLVDDETEFTDTLSQRLTHRGLQVDTAANGREALEKIKHARYDAIILDLRMPEMDGIETLKRLQTEDPDVQILLLTGHATVQAGIEAVREGAMEVLEKPADIQKLMLLIEEASNRKMMLFEKRREDEISDILKSKGW
jgi:DNA-binding NtrC family response regulator